MAFSSIYGRLRSPAEVPNLRRDDAALKRYESVTDPRAISMEGTEKATFILDIVKQTPCDVDNQATAEETEDIAGMSKQMLVKRYEELHREIKVKDVELDKVRKLFARASRKLEEMKEIIDSNQQTDMKLRASEAQIQKLKEDHIKKDEKIESMQKEFKELRCVSSAHVETEQAWLEIKNRSQMLDDVVQERNKLKENLCKMMGFSEILHRMRDRANQADLLETEVDKLRRELERIGYGAAGDSAPKKRPETSCKQCDKIADDLSRSEGVLENALKKLSCFEAERNILQERVRALEVMEAEYILYKVKYEQAECKIFKLKEMVVKAEGNEKEIRDLQRQLNETEQNLEESQRKVEDLITNVERQAMDLEERDLYIDNLNRRQSVQENPSQKSVKMGDVPAGKVQSIVKRLCNDHESVATNCKSGFNKCQCGLPKESRGPSRTISLRRQTSCATQKSSVDSCKSKEFVTGSSNLQLTPKQSCQSVPSNGSVSMKEINRLQEETSSEEVRLLREQNAELDEQLKSCKRELEEISQFIIEIEKQRESNSGLESEANQLKRNHEQEMSNLQSSFRTSLTEKEDECCQLQQQLNQELLKAEKLERKRASHCNEIKELRPLQNRCQELEEILNCAKSKLAERSQEVECLRGECAQFVEEKKKLVKRIDEVTFDLDEYRKYAKSLADQLCKRQQQKEKTPEDPADNKEMLRKYVCDLKQYYERLKQEKDEQALCFRTKIECLNEEIETLKCSQKAEAAKPVKECECDWSSPDSCVDILLQKVGQFGLESLLHDELIEMHHRVRCAMMQLKKLPQPLSIPNYSDYYTKMADDLRIKYNLSDALPSVKSQDLPVKDIDICSSKTMPKGAKQGTEAGVKCVSVSRKLRKT